MKPAGPGSSWCDQRQRI